MAVREIVRGQLRGDPAPRECEPGAHHRDRCGRAVHRAQQVGEQARRAQRDEHDDERELVGCVRRAARGGREPDARHTGEDREDAQVLIAARRLSQHALAGEHQHEQAHGQRRLHHDQRREQQRHDLKRPPQHREPGTEQPAPTPHQSSRQREAQVLLVRRLARVERLQSDP